MVAKFSLERMLTYEKKIDKVNFKVLIGGYEKERPVLYKIRPPGILEVGQSLYIRSGSPYATCMMEICLKKKEKVIQLPKLQRVRAIKFVLQRKRIFLREVTPLSIISL
ncbi:OLC1v1014054C1 [Oldenlandia corymbosa var. corymbosa]|uniref:OLC1v1014054C1 n=1 Tax=Oldenlandia corymbosa var. corymbosa TaxID=529605 RepID=A0AAV1DZY8_OLDCO|nr:OLC1v1014054C1 [Oldenlandia corymbosa var. corymbosa]